MALPTIAQGEPYIYTILVDTNGNPLAAIPTNNPSIGTDGNPIPLSSTLIGATDGTNLQPLHVDGGGNLKVNVSASGQQTVTQSNPANLNATVVQGTGASQGTSWRLKGDSAEQSGLSASALNALLVPMTDVSQYKSFSLQVSGTFSASFTVEGSNDGTTFYSFPIEDNFANIITSGGVTYIGLFRGPCCYRYIRVRLSGYSSGTVNGVFELYTFPFSPSAVIAQEGADFKRDPWTFRSTNDYPSGATPITASSGNVANAQGVATLAAGGKTTYIAGFEITGSGATLGLPVTVTVTGTISGTLSYTYSAVAGVLLENQSLIVSFTPPVPASAANTSIVVTCPALGSGNTNNVVNARGYQL